MTRKEAPPQPERQPGAPWSLDAAASYLGISRRALERLITAEKVKSILLGHRRLISCAELERLATEGC